MTRRQRLQQQIRKSPARQARQLRNRKGRAWAREHTTPGLPRGWRQLGYVDDTGGAPPISVEQYEAAHDELAAAGDPNPDSTLARLPWDHPGADILGDIRRAVQKLTDDPDARYGHLYFGSPDPVWPPEGSTVLDSWPGGVQMLMGTTVFHLFWPVPPPPEPKPWRKHRPNRYAREAR